MPSFDKRAIEIGVFIKQAEIDGAITCPECKNKIEPDAKKCICGWENPLVKQGFI